MTFEQLEERIAVLFKELESLGKRLKEQNDALGDQTDGEDVRILLNLMNEYDDKQHELTRLIQEAAVRVHHMNRRKGGWEL